MQGLYGEGLALHSGGTGLSSTWYIENAVNGQKTHLTLSLNRLRETQGCVWRHAFLVLKDAERGGTQPGVWAHMTAWTHPNTENHLALHVKDAELEETSVERFVVGLENGHPVVCIFICTELFIISFISGSGAEHPLLWTLASHGKPPSHALR